MRFSLRTFLLATAYLTLVFGTVISRSAALSALVWLITAIVICYAFVMLCFAGGKHKAMALGCVLMSLAYFAVVYFAPARTLAGEVFGDMGYATTQGGWYSVRSNTFVPGIQAIVNALNAAGTMLAGVIGFGIGALAYRHFHEP